MFVVDIDHFTLENQANLPSDFLANRKLKFSLARTKLFKFFHGREPSSFILPLTSNLDLPRHHTLPHCSCAVGTILNLPLFYISSYNVKNVFQRRGKQKAPLADARSRIQLGAVWPRLWLPGNEPAGSVQCFSARLPGCSGLRLPSTANDPARSVQCVPPEFLPPPGSSKCPTGPKNFVRNQGAYYAGSAGNRR